MKQILLVALTLMLGYQVKAVKIESGKNVTIDKPVYEDVYVTGGEIMINAPVDAIINNLIPAGGF